MIHPGNFELREATDPIHDEGVECLFPKNDLDGVGIDTDSSSAFNNISVNCFGFCFVEKFEFSCQYFVERVGDEGDGDIKINLYND